MAGTTYKELGETVTAILDSGFLTAAVGNKTNGKQAKVQRVWDGLFCRWRVRCLRRRRTETIVQITFS